MNRAFRWIWGIATLLSCGWIVYGLAATSAVVSQVASVTPTVQVVKNAAGTPVATVDPKLIQAAAAAGTVVGAGISTTIFLCTGIPALLLFGFLYWRNGVAMRNAKQHAETIDALKTGKA